MVDNSNILRIMWTEHHMVYQSHRSLLSVYLHVHVPCAYMYLIHVHVCVCVCVCVCALGLWMVSPTLSCLTSKRQLSSLSRRREPPMLWQLPWPTSLEPRRSFLGHCFQPIRYTMYIHYSTLSSLMTTCTRRCGNVVSINLCILWSWGWLLDVNIFANPDHQLVDPVYVVLSLLGWQVQRYCCYQK